MLALHLCVHLRLRSEFAKKNNIMSRRARFCLVWSQCPCGDTVFSLCLRYTCVFISVCAVRQAPSIGIMRSHICDYMLGRLCQGGSPRLLRCTYLSHGVGFLCQRLKYRRSVGTVSLHPLTRSLGRARALLFLNRGPIRNTAQGGRLSSGSRTRRRCRTSRTRRTLAGRSGPGWARSDGPTNGCVSSTKQRPYIALAIG